MLPVTDFPSLNREELCSLCKPLAYYNATLFASTRCRSICELTIWKWAQMKKEGNQNYNQSQLNSPVQCKAIVMN